MGANSQRDLSLVRRAWRRLGGPLRSAVAKVRSVSATVVRHPAMRLTKRLASVAKVVQYVVAIVVVGGGVAALVWFFSIKAIFIEDVEIAQQLQGQGFDG